MKTITIEKKLYDYDELTEQAKEKAKQDFLYIYRQDGDDFYEYSVNELNSFFFPNSELNVEYTLSYCQGDGFNIYGKMDLKDAINFVMQRRKEKVEKKSKKFVRFLKWLSEQGYTIELPNNKMRYSYCYVECADYDYQILDCLEQDGYTSGYEEKENLLEYFDAYFKSCIKELCKEFENNGYKYFYEVEEEEIKEFAEDIGFMFEENGEIYYL